MRNARRIAAIALLGGLVAGLGGKTAQAQNFNQARFVSILISREAALIYKDRVAIAKQNRHSQVLNLLLAGPRSSEIQSMIASLRTSVTRLQGRINKFNSQLSALNLQVTANVATLPSPNPYQQPSSLNTAVIQSLVNRPPFGIPPSTTIQ